MIEDMVARTKNTAAVKDTILHALPLTADMMRKRVYIHYTTLLKRGESEILTYRCECT
jgi:hypothetical protein